jgi:hypothetical protein
MPSFPFREINFVDETVRTLAGNGTKGSDYRGGGQGTNQAGSDIFSLATLESSYQKQKTSAYNFYKLHRLFLTLFWFTLKWHLWLLEEHEILLETSCKYQ